MHRTTSLLALGLFLGLAPIGAQAQTTSTDTNVEVTQPADSGQSTETEVLKTDDQQATDTDTMDTDDQQATDSGTMSTDTQSTQTDTMSTGDQQSTETTVIDADDQQSTETEVIATDEPAVTTDVVEPVIPAQNENEMLASSLLGAEVNLADESIGKVSDLIIGDDHMIKGVVVGVGGFLGIGEKNVALSMDMITVQPTEEPGEFELSANTTREELESFESFKTASDVRAEFEAEQAATQAQSQQPAAVPTAPVEPAE